ncbi:hypothetical protein AGMMS49942_24210 [Spirochaetia bacterium]|nr:hypothetical protein AGMMS49942_24210 [Spirochaetia bacterium]
MQILWDDKKNVRLIAERGISFTEFAGLILEKNIILKTVFPSRKYHKLYGGKENERDT